MFGNQGYTKSVRQAVDKSVALSLFAVLYIGYNMLEVSIVGHRLQVSLAEVVKL